MPNAATKPGTVTHAAHVAQDRETGSLEVVITRDVYAGIYGPCEVFVPNGLDLDGLRLDLLARGYEVTGDWTIGTSYQGMTLTAEVFPL